MVCLPDDVPELNDDADMVSQVRLFIKDCYVQQIAERPHPLLMDPVDRWLEDLMNLNIANGACDARHYSNNFLNFGAGLDVFNATSFTPPLLDWQSEALDLNAALTDAIKNMGKQLLLLRPAMFQNPFEKTQSFGDAQPSQHEEAPRRTTDSNPEDIWQPHNPWSALHYDPLSSPLKLGGGAAIMLSRSPTKADRESEQAAVAAAAEAEAQAASEKVFACVQKRVVIATRELIADKKRRMLPPQWLYACVSITSFVFKMCELEQQRQLRKEFLQSDVRLQLYTIYCRFEAEEVGRLAHAALKLLATVMSEP